MFQSHKDQGTTPEIKGETYAIRWPGFGLLGVRGDLTPGAQNQGQSRSKNQAAWSLIL